MGKLSTDMTMLPSRQDLLARKTYKCGRKNWRKLKTENRKWRCLAVFFQGSILTTCCTSYQSFSLLQQVNFWDTCKEGSFQTFFCEPKWETVFQLVVNRIQWWWWWCWGERIEKTITNCLTVDEKYCWLRICRLLHFDLMAGWQNDNPLTQFQSFLEKYLSLATVVRISCLKTEHAKNTKIFFILVWWLLAWSSSIFCANMGFFYFCCLPDVIVTFEGEEPFWCCFVDKSLVDYQSNPFVSLTFNYVRNDGIS